MIDRRTFVIQTLATAFSVRSLLKRRDPVRIPVRRNWREGDSVVCVGGPFHGCVVSLCDDFAVDEGRYVVRVLLGPDAPKYALIYEFRRADAPEYLLTQRDAWVGHLVRWPDRAWPEVFVEIG